MIYLPSSMHAMPQFFSPDYFVRVSTAELDGIVFEHLFTVQDAGVLEDSKILRECKQCMAGTTEWVARTPAATISLGWDWVCLGDGELRALEAVAPRTNLKLVDAVGYDMSCDEASPHLWSRISAIDWLHSVMETIRPAARVGTDSVPF